MFVGQTMGWYQSVTHTFADEFARRMQVMVDGRSVYLPSFGGVRWDTLPLAIQDIERIEVVRGPNAASFGANAFTGIINSITRHPDDVTGRTLNLSGGEHDRREAWFRWAGSSESGSHRISLGDRREGGMTFQDDDESSQILNYRGEFSLGARENLGIQFGSLSGTRGIGDVADSPDLHFEQDVKSVFFQTDYRLELNSGSLVQGKFFFNRLKTTEDAPLAAIPSLIPPGAYFESDLMAQRWHAELQLNSSHGTNLRSAVGAYLRRDSVKSLLFWNRTDSLDVDSRGVFGHLEWRFSDTWLVNAGAFWEDYELVDSKLSPRVTLHWQPSAQHAFRIGVSRAFRNPVLFETSADRRVRVLASDGSLLGVLPPLFLSQGDVAPESIVSREIAYLGQWPDKDLTLDVRLFKEHISNYIDSVCPSVDEEDCKARNLLSPSYQPRYWDNVGDAWQQGYEIQAKWNPTPANMVMLNHAYLNIDSQLGEVRYSPPHMTGLHLMHGFPGGIEMTLSHYWVSSFQAIGQGPIPSYKRLDARLAKRFRLQDMSGLIALTWQNLSNAYLSFDNETPVDLFDRRAEFNFSSISESLRSPG